jgi:tartrate-resistant acid phosphatase type 5
MKKRVRFFLVFGVILLLTAACSSQPTTTPLPATQTEPPRPASTIPLADTLTPTTAVPQPSPTPIPTPSLRFAVIGDYGSAGPDLAAVAALIDSWQVDLIITTGDNNYSIGSPYTIDENIGQYFHAYIYPYRGNYGEGAQHNRFFPSLGNHDWLWLDAQPYLDYFELPGNERYYSFSAGFIDFFALSSDWEEPDGITADSIQGEWLETELAASTAAWQVVFFHHAPYSSGNHGSTKHMQWPFQAWGADVVLSGHDHHYERLEIDGIPYFVQGLSGGSIYNINQPIPGSQFRYNETYGALLIDATPEEMQFRFYNIEGELVDEYFLNK